MDYKQTKDLVSNAVEQTLGKEYLGEHPLDVTELVDIGRDIEEGGKLDFFTKALYDQLGKFIVETRKYVGRVPKLYKDSWEYGAYTESVDIELPSYSINNSIELVDGIEYPDNIFYGTKVQGSIFKERKTLEVRKSYTEEMEELKQAFTGWSQMQAFVGAIQLSVENALELGYEVMTEMVLSAAAAVCNYATQNVINLRSIYNDSFGKTLAYDDCLTDQEFMRWASYTIGLYRERFSKYGEFFNNKTIATFTPPEEVRLTLLSNFAKAAEVYLYADTYNREDVARGLGTYDTVAFWQGNHKSGEDDWALDAVSGISIVDTDNKLGTGQSGTINLDGIIGLMWDNKAIGINNERKKTTSNYNGSADFITYYHKTYANYWVNPRRNMLLFTIN